MLTHVYLDRPIALNNSRIKFTRDYHILTYCISQCIIHQRGPHYRLLLITTVPRQISHKTLSSAVNRVARSWQLSPFAQLCDFPNPSSPCSLRGTSLKKPLASCLLISPSVHVFYSASGMLPLGLSSLPLQLVFPGS